MLHPNLLPLLGYYADQFFTYLVLPLREGGDLGDALHLLARAPRPLSALRPVDRIHVAHQVAAGLAALHNATIIHRDLKPANILLTSVAGTWSAQLADFGLSRDVPNGLTHATTGVRGTPGFRCPEYCVTGQARNQSDVYSLGFVLLLLLTDCTIDELARFKAGSDKFTELCPHAQMYLDQPQASLPGIMAHALQRGVNWTAGEAETLLRLCKDCLQADSRQRPHALDVCLTLRLLLPLAEVDASLTAALSRPSAPAPDAEMEVANTASPTTAPAPPPARETELPAHATGWQEQKGASRLVAGQRILRSGWRTGTTYVERGQTIRYEGPDMPNTTCGCECGCSLSKTWSGKPAFTLVGPSNLHSDLGFIPAKNNETQLFFVVCPACSEQLQRTSGEGVCALGDERAAIRSRDIGFEQNGLDFHLQCFGE